MKYVLSVIAIASLTLVFTAAAVSCQDSAGNSPSMGFQPNQVYSLDGVESIGYQNGNLMYNIPLASPPAGRGTAPVPMVSLSYNSKLYETKTTQTQFGTETYFVFSSGSGWRYNYSYGLKVSGRKHTSDQNWGYRTEIIFPDGGAHTVHPVGYSQVTVVGYPLDYYDVTPGHLSTPMTYFSADGTFFRVTVNPNGTPNYRNDDIWTLQFTNGTQVEHHEADSWERVTDRNGNFYTVEVDLDGQGTDKITFTDQLGRQVIIDTDGDGLRAGTDHIRYKGFNGADLNTVITWGTTQPRGKAYLYLGDEVGYTHNLSLVSKVVRNIALPNGLSYGFEYNSDTGINDSNDPNESLGFGELYRVTLPGGAKVKYGYSKDSYPEEATPGAMMPDEILEGQIAKKTLEYDETYDGATQTRQDVWLYEGGKGIGTVTGPDGSTTLIGGGGVDSGIAASPCTSQTFVALAPDGTKTEKIWAKNIPASNASTCGNPYIKTEFTSIKDANGNYTLTAIKEFAQDKNGNTTEIKEYDWVAYSSLPRDSYGAVTGLPSGATPVRVTKYTYYNDTPDAASTNYTDGDSYHLASSPQTRKSVKSSEVQDSSGTPKTRTELTYDNASTTANITSTKVWDSSKGAYSNPLTTANSISTTAVYDQYGNPTLATDAKGNQTQITYGAVNGFTGLYPTQTISAYQTLIARTSRAAYDFYTGLATTVTDVDNNVSVATEYDALGRPTKVRSAAGTALESWTRTEYNDTARRVIVRSDIETKGDGRKVAIQHFDQLGRVRLARTLEDAATEDPTNETHGIKVETRYQTGNPNSYQLTSNPFRATYASQATNEATMGWARSKAVNTGRHSEVETFSGAALPAPWGSNTNSTGKVQTDIDTNTTTVTDQAGRQRRSITNALGQLVRVDEPNDAGQIDVNGVPVQSTNYSYDPLNNLITVVQGGQTRNFVYSSLSRMTSETSPEAGTTTYEYDSNGNPIKKTDARGVSSNLTYDTLNRVTQKSYTGESDYVTPTISLSYDDPTIPNSKGKLTKVTRAISETCYLAFDQAGRITSSRQTTDGTDYNFQYAYNLAGMLIEETYPSGRKVKNVLDASGDLSLLQSKKNANYGYFNYAKSFSYAPSGAVTRMQLGNGQWQNSVYNSRLQATQIAQGTTSGTTNILKLDFDYGSAQNNGNLLSQSITVPTVGSNTGFTAIQNYSYDSLNRIKQATETISGNQTWKQTFTFDRFGNRNFDEASTTTLPKLCNGNTEVCASDRKIYNPAVNSANNRLSTTDNYSYDITGNTINDAQARSFKYDAENKQYEVRNSQSQIIGQYYFDGNGKRVKKVVPGTGETTIFVYDSTGRLSAEYSTNLSQTQQVSYVTADHLGSPRIKTDQNGAVIARNDYLPYGEDISTSQRTQALGYKPDDVRQKFTGYERDIESDLDFAQARYYNKNHGRFTSVDPLAASASPSDPQTFNRYIYVRNSPLVMTDPTGMIGDYYNYRGEWLGTDGKFDGKVYFATETRRDDNSTYIDANSIQETTVAELQKAEVAAVPLQPGNETAAIQQFAAAGAEAANNAITGLRNGAVNTVTGAFNNNPITQATGVGLPTLQAENAKQAAYATAVPIGVAIGSGVAGAAVAPASSVSVVPETVAATRTPAFLGQANGPAIAIPNGASATPVINQSGSVTGLGFTGGQAGNGLNNAVTSVRIMNPTSRYPNGYVTYMNQSRQGVHPITGRTLPNNDPMRHIPLNR